MSETWKDWVAKARDVPIENELARRSIKLLGRGPERYGPCPVCVGTDRFSINTVKQVWNCRHCVKGGKGAIDLVMFIDGVEFAAACEKLTRDPPPKNQNGKTADQEWPTKARTEANESDLTHRAERLRKALWLWGRSEPIAGTFAERYLWARGYTGPVPDTVRFLPASGDYPPAMIAAFGLAHETEPGVIRIDTNAIKGVHLTRLLPDGSDRDRGEKGKIMIGLSTGSPIVLAPPNDLLGLAITEGIEDGLSVRKATGLGVWAAGTGGRMPALAEVVPDYIECVTIFAHDDDTGWDGATKLADALTSRKIDVIMEGGR